MHRDLNLDILMNDFCKIHAEKPETVLKAAARNYIRRETIEGMSVTKLLQERMNELSARFNDDSNAQRGENERGWDAQKRGGAEKPPHPTSNEKDGYWFFRSQRPSEIK